MQELSKAHTVSIAKKNFIIPLTVSESIKKGMSFSVYRKLVAFFIHIVNFYVLTVCGLVGGVSVITHVQDYILS